MKYIIIALILMIGAVGIVNAAPMTASDFEIFDITTLNANAKGFQWGCHDDRYIYFAPYRNSASNFFGLIPRYDTHGALNDAASWTFFDVSTVDAWAKGFIGCSFDGKYIYFAGSRAYDTYHGRVARYDTTSNFSTASSWTVFNAATVNSLSIGFEATVFDGTYIYFLPFIAVGADHSGLITRYDTTASFTNVASWSTYDLEALNSSAAGYPGATFDGRYIYYTPNHNDVIGKHGVVTRYDTTMSFTYPGSYSFFNTMAYDSNSAEFVYDGWDGRYVYFTQNYDAALTGGQVTRYDTTGTFTTPASWQYVDLTDFNPLALGGTGAIFDGRYMYFPPSYNGVSWNGLLPRYDTTMSFTDTNAWTFFDMAAELDATIGDTTGGVIVDGYIYYIPGPKGGTAPSGLVVKQDVGTGSPPATFDTSNAIPQKIFKCQTSTIWVNLTGAITGVTLWVNITGVMVNGTPRSETNSYAMISNGSGGWYYNYGNDNTLLWGNKSIAFLVVGNTDINTTSTHVFVYSDECTGTDIQGYQNVSYRSGGFGNYTRPLFTGERDLVSFSIFPYLDYWGYVIYLIVIAVLIGVIYIKTQSVMSPIIVGFVAIAGLVGSNLIPDMYKNYILLIMAVAFAAIVWRLFKSA